MISEAVNSSDSMHKLSNKWTIYAHLPHDTDWSLKSYKTLYTTSYLEEFITLTESLPDKLISNCMLFIMKDNIKPIWEDELNKSGGCFSYKIATQDADEKWFDLCAKVLSETLSEKECYNQNINGISITPKKNANILRIWLKDNDLVNPEFYNISTTKFSTLLYKKHKN